MVRGKILFLIITGPENPDRLVWGLRMAHNIHTHPYGEKIIDDVRVLLFCGGVKIVDPGAPSEIHERLEDLLEAGVEVASCLSIAEPMGLDDVTESMGIRLVHASVYVAERVSEGYTIMTF